MPHLTLTYPLEGPPRRGSFWRQVHRNMHDRLNMVILVGPAKRSQLHRSLRRYAVQHGVPCIVKDLEEGVGVAFL